MVRVELTSAPTAGVGTIHSTSLTLLLLRVIRTQLYMRLQTKMDTVRTSTVARKSSLGGPYIRVGGFAFVPGGLDMEKLMKPPMIYSVSYFDLRGLSSLFGRSKPTKAPRGDETGSNSKIIPANVFPVSSEISDLRN